MQARSIVLYIGHGFPCGHSQMYPAVSDVMLHGPKCFMVTILGRRCDFTITMHERFLVHSQLRFVVSLPIQVLILRRQ